MINFLRPQSTVTRKINFSGIGVHSGLIANLSVLPAPENTGFVFKRIDVRDKNNEIEVKAENVSESIMCTKVVNSEGVSVSVIEHLLASFKISGITNAFIEIDTEEIPIMDGSSFVFLKEFLKAGIKKQSASVKAILIQSEVCIQSDNGYIIAMPSMMEQSICISLNYERINSVIKRNNFVTFTMNDKLKLRSIASSRTFGWMEDYEKFHAMGFAKGTSLDNTIVITPENTILNKEGLRNKHEIVFHKALDLIGDFSLLDYDIIGSIRGVNTSHLQNNLFIKKLMSEIHLHTIIQSNNELQYAFLRKKQNFEDQFQLIR